MHRLAQHTGQVAALDQHVTRLKRHVPYHESDHVLNVAYHILCGGTCVQDIERRRQDEVYLDALCARVTRATGGVLRRGGDRRGRYAGRDHRAVQGRDGHRLQLGGYHPLLVSLANTGEPLFLVNLSGNRPSSEGAAARFDQARVRCQDAGFRRMTFRGDTDVSQTAHLDRWDTAGVRFLFGYDARAHLIREADARPAAAWTPLVRRPRYEVQTEPRAHRPNVKAATIVARAFKTFVNACMRVPVQVVRTSRRIVFRWLAWNPWQDVFLRGFDQRHEPLRS